MAKKRATGGRKPKARGRAPKDAARTGPRDVTAAARRFVQDVQVRGEAAKPDKGGKLPLGATHAIVSEKPDGTIEIQRVRFKAF
jgi:hypothetical protein